MASIKNNKVELGLKKIPYRRGSMGLNPNYVLELRDEPLKGNKTGTYRDEA